METVLEDHEVKTIEKFRKLISRNMGVTFQGHQFTLRADNCSISGSISYVQTEGVAEPDDDECHGCGVHWGLKEHEVKGAEFFKIKLCPDCYSPK